MTTTNLSIGERALLEGYRSNNAANARGLTAELAREADQRRGDVASEPGGVDSVETEVAGVPAMWLLPHGYV